MSGAEAAAVPAAAAATEKEFTYADVATHNSRRNIHVVIHDKVFDASKFVDEHPVEFQYRGGEEVLMDVAGQDATEAFEDVGHSDEAREILSTLLVGTLKRLPGDPKPNVSAPAGSASISSSSSTGVSGGGIGAPGSSSGFGFGLYALMLVGAGLAYGAWKYLAATRGNEASGGVKL